MLTASTLYTFKESRIYNSPTEILLLKTITSIKSCEDETQKEFSFVLSWATQRVDTNERGYYMCATSVADKEQWIGQIGKAMVKLNTKSHEPDFDWIMYRVGSKASDCIGEALGIFVS